MAVFLTIEGCLSTTLWIIEWTTELEQDFSHQQYDVGAVIHIPPGHCIWEYVAVWMSSSFSKIYLPKLTCHIFWDQLKLPDLEHVCIKPHCTLTRDGISMNLDFPSPDNLLLNNYCFSEHDVSHFRTFPQILGSIQLVEVLLLPDSPWVLTAACFAQAWWGTIDGAARRAASLMDETWASQPATPQTLEKHQQSPRFEWFCILYVFFFRIPTWNLCKGFKFSGFFNSHLN